jgi:hypothetical protein
MSLTTITTAFPPGGSGTITITDTTAAAIIAQTAANELLWGNAGLIIPGSPIAVMSATQGTLNNIYEQLKAMDSKLESVVGQVTDLNGQMEKSRTGLASISTHMGQQATIQKLAFLDQTKHNEFQQQTTNASLKDAGKPPTVVTPAAFVTKVQSTLQDLTVINAQTSIVTTISDYATDTINTAFTESLAWAAKTEVGGWVVTQYGRIKGFLAGLFTAEKAKEIARDVNQSALNVKGGNPTNLG